MRTLLAALLLVASHLVATKLEAAPIYRLEFEGPPGDFISLGQHVVLTENDVGLSTFVADFTGDGLADSVQFISSGVGQLSFLLFFDTDKIAANLFPGTYPDAQRSPFADPGHPGFWLAWDHRGCNRILGSYAISDAVFGPSGPILFSGRFEQSCEEFMPPLTGTFAFADVPIPEPSSVLLLGVGIAGLFSSRVFGRARPR